MPTSETISVKHGDYIGWLVEFAFVIIYDLLQTTLIGKIGKFRAYVLLVNRFSGKLIVA